ncbi:MAG: MarR family transcriptional regulator [Chloroflexi bacterium]|nr:MarR family transcriptional regulator [Chloroflexota bacterium]
MSQTKEPYRGAAGARLAPGAGGTGGAPGAPGDRDARLARIQAAHERLMTLLAATHTAEFLEVGMTMSQAKVLYLVASAGEIHMAELPARLGVSLSTVSGLVDRLVDHDLVDRREDPADRRQVIVRPTAGGLAAMDRFHDLNARQLRELLDRVDPADLPQVERAYAVLVDAAASMPDAIRGADTAAATTAPRTVTDSRKEGL